MAREKMKQVQNTRIDNYTTLH